jgi:small subunit ribosomal protein S8
MSMTDPIADLLTRIPQRSSREAQDRGRAGLENEGRHRDDPQGRGVRRQLQDGRGPRFRNRSASSSSTALGGERAIQGSSACRRPGRRVYCGKDEIPKVLDGLGLTILSTPKGVLTGKVLPPLGRRRRNPLQRLVAGERGEGRHVSYR